jgi:hypothetical protein
MSKLRGGSDPSFLSTPRPTQSGFSHVNEFAATESKLRQGRSDSYEAQFRNKLGNPGRFQHPTPEAAGAWHAHSWVCARHVGICQAILRFLSYQIVYSAAHSSHKGGWAGKMKRVPHRGFGWNVSSAIAIGYSLCGTPWSM